MREIASSLTRRIAVFACFLLLVSCSGTRNDVSRRPPRFAVVTTSGELQLRRSDDGKVIRTITRLDVRYRSAGDAPHLAVDPRVRYFYHDASFLPECELHEEPREPADLLPQAPVAPAIARISTSDAKSKTIDVGSEPALSPDGTKLAYITGSDPEECGRAGQRDVLAVRNLRTGTAKRWRLKNGAIFAPLWTNDGHRVIFQRHRQLVENGEHGRTVITYHSFSTDGRDSLDKAPEVPIRDDYSVAGFMSRDELLVWRFTGTEGRGPRELLTIDPGTGRRLRSIVRVEASDVATFWVRVNATHLLIYRGAWRDSHEDPLDLSRYTVGDRAPAEISTDVIAAQWAGTY